MSGAFRSYGILPAAGTSSRMGRPKLLVSVGGRTVIERVVAAFREGGVDEVLVVTRPGDDELRVAACTAGATVVVPDKPPAEMKHSIGIALQHIDKKFSPIPQDAWLMAPADIPFLSAAVVRRLLSHHSMNPETIIVPAHNGRRGHPVLIPWTMAKLVATLGVDQGINSLIDTGPVEYIELGPEAVPMDIDTPDDLRIAEGGKANTDG